MNAIDTQIYAYTIYDSCYGCVYILFSLPRLTRKIEQVLRYPFERTMAHDS